MATYLKLYETQAAYDSEESGLTLPNVSLVTENNTVYYNPLTPTPPTPSHDYVEIGGIKWATMNVGAESIGDYGNYYMYGKGAEDYFVTSGDTTYDGTEDPLSSSVDTATQAWGGNWRTPTKDEFESLIENTTNEYMTIGEVEGYKFTDNSDSSKFIFLPLAGYYDDAVNTSTNYYGYYISSTPEEYDDSLVCTLFIDGGEGGNTYTLTQGRRYGLSVRPVYDGA